MGWFLTGRDYLLVVCQVSAANGAPSVGDGVERLASMADRAPSPCRTAQWPSAENDRSGAPGRLEHLARVRAGTFSVNLKKYISRLTERAVDRKNETCLVFTVIRFSISSFIQFCNRLGIGNSI
jgi:hypothetical protein